LRNRFLCRPQIFTFMSVMVIALRPARPRSRRRAGVERMEPRRRHWLWHAERGAPRRSATNSTTHLYRDGKKLSCFRPRPERQASLPRRWDLPKIRRYFASAG
jgi:hypothetical protein